MHRLIIYYMYSIRSFVPCRCLITKVQFDTFLAVYQHLIATIEYKYINVEDQFFALTIKSEIFFMYSMGPTVAR